MNAIEFSKDIPADKLAEIFKDFFDQHMLAYSILKDVEFIQINNISYSEASIMYSVRLLNTENKDKLVSSLQSNSASLLIYGKRYTPEIYLNGDLLCITIKK